MVRVRARVGMGSKKHPKRLPAPVYCCADLEQRLRDHVVSFGAQGALNLGEYMSVPTTHAVRGTALVKLEGLIRCLLTVSPKGYLNYKDLKSAVLVLARSYANLVPSAFKCLGE